MAKTCTVFHFRILLLAWLASVCWSGKAVGQESEEQYLTVEQAREYMLTLINRDRAKHALGPVILDQAACQAGQVHTIDMVLNNHHGHYDCDGKKPWQRYTEAGGQGYVSENAYWWPGRHYEGLSAEEMAADTDKPFALHPVQTFKKSDIERAENDYYNEKPPNDGHRKNILDKIHNGVGIAFSLASNGALYRFANTQEFTDNYGQFAPLPPTLGGPFTVTGTLAPGWKLHSISILCEQPPQAMMPEDMEKLHSYTHPSKTIDDFFPLSYSKNPIQTQMTNGVQQFRLEVVPKSWKKGLYYVDIRACYGNNKNIDVISRRTIRNY